ncbi:hypothetical protein U9M73_21690 [Paenibacillus phoenicis]|uniref:Uncharacterized protein n=1 Tax=Paenibacillus phoenicis TaxID=554117 RepID=A0ABU5PRF8_9BACL|nr:MULTISPECIES: hypothetical protein [Paenibacillus]MCT2195294.1 hypothetical protein [Paenibacillus sp. p3-SID1389]MEA3572544.1 hypothetical protein [Paenibacillus phoenicis]
MSWRGWFWSRLGCRRIRSGKLSLETPFRSSIEIELLEEGVEIRHAVNVSFGETTSAPIRGHLQ